jgi:hypothetical protein
MQVNANPEDKALSRFAKKTRYKKLIVTYLTKMDIVTKQPMASGLGQQLRSQ